MNVSGQKITQLNIDSFTGDWLKISSGSISANAYSVEISNLDTNYKSYKILTNVFLSGASYAIRLQLKTNNTLRQDGSYSSTGKYEYSYSYQEVSQTSAVLGQSSGTTRWSVEATIIQEPSSNPMVGFAMGTSGNGNPTNGSFYYGGSGYAYPIDGFQISWGNQCSSGWYVIYALKE